jgi:transcription initiation factor TFIID subunit 2
VHNLHVEDTLATKFEIQCHSKGKRNKKKKIPLITGDEVDIDTSQMDSDCPILWIRIDSDLRVMREQRLEQPDHHWQNQLRHERDVCAQLDAIDTLARFPSAATRSALISAVENGEMFYRVRVHAANVLTDVSNKMMATAWNGPLPLVSSFKKLFTHASTHLVYANTFHSDLQAYFIQKSLPLAMARLRNAHNVCPSEIVRFLLDLIKYNENSKNQLTDVYYRAALIDSLATTVSLSAAVVVAADAPLGPRSGSLTPDTRLVIEEIVLRLNLEKFLPTLNFVITCSCLNALRVLQKLGHIPDNVEIFKQYADYENNFENVRMVVFEIMTECLSGWF